MFGITFEELLKTAVNAMVAMIASVTSSYLMTRYVLQRFEKLKKNMERRIKRGKRG